MRRSDTSPEQGRPGRRLQRLGLRLPRAAEIRSRHRPGSAPHPRHDGRGSEAPGIPTQADMLATATLQTGKSADGLQAVQWWRKAASTSCSITVDRMLRPTGSMRLGKQNSVSPVLRSSVQAQTRPGRLVDVGNRLSDFLDIDSDAAVRSNDDHEESQGRDPVLPCLLGRLARLAPQIALIALR